MDKGKIRAFLDRYAMGTHSEEEHQSYLEWQKQASISEIEEAIDYLDKVTGNKAQATGSDNINLKTQIEKAIDQYELGSAVASEKSIVIRMGLVRKLAAAVLFGGLLLGAVYLILNRKTDLSPINDTIVNGKGSDILPGSNKAVLTLADGSIIALDEAGTGLIAEDGSTRINKMPNGRIVYNEAKTSPAESRFNTLSTPRGGQYRLVLPDGSEVWLNAASSIRYPTAFIGNDRTVEISGEAYFEIKHDAGKPFHVKLNGLQIEVLGTHFNVNSYSEESNVRTTLLEGSVRLTNEKSEVKIKPGQQAQLSSSGAFKVVNDVDVDQVMAWKNGYFSFAKADLPAVMRQIARWYDVDIEYKGAIPERKFSGKISRDTKASEVLKILQELKVNFKIEGSKIIVTK